MRTAGSYMSSTWTISGDLLASPEPLVTISLDRPSLTAWGPPQLSAADPAIEDRGAGTRTQRRRKSAHPSIVTG
jgi:hypothetical protein